MEILGNSCHHPRSMMPANGSGNHKQGFYVNWLFSVESVSQHPECNCFCLGNGIFFGITVGHNTRKPNHFSNPPPVLFFFYLNAVRWLWHFHDDCSRRYLVVKHRLLSYL